MQTITASRTVLKMRAPIRFGRAAVRAFVYARRVTLGHAPVSAA